MAKKKQAIVTPPMIIRYAYLVTPSTTHKKEGQYTVKVAIQDGTPEAEALKETLMELKAKVLPEVTKDLNPAQRKKLIEVNPWMIEEDKETGEETGYITMTFGMLAQVTRKKDGKVFEFTPDLFDGGNNLIPLDVRKDLKIGGGTIVRVSFSADRGYCMEAQGADGKKFHKAGISVDLMAVKILELVEYGASAGSYGFGDDDDGSFTAPTKPAPASSDSPFGDDGDVPADGDGDF